MIIMPNVPAIIETKKAHKIMKLVASKMSDSVEFKEAKNWKSDTFFSPEFVMMDSDGDIHLFYTFINSIDISDNIEEISESLVDKKICKKLTKEFAEDFEDELEDDSNIYVEVMFLITKGNTINKGTVAGCTVYNRKVKVKSKE